MGLAQARPNYIALASLFFISVVISNLQFLHPLFGQALFIQNNYHGTFASAIERKRNVNRLILFRENWSSISRDSVNDCNARTQYIFYGETPSSMSMCGIDHYQFAFVNPSAMSVLWIDLVILLSE